MVNMTIKKFLPNYQLSIIHYQLKGLHLQNYIGRYFPYQEPMLEVARY